MMKKLIYFTSIVAIVLATSCSEEYLDTDNLYGKSLETFYKTPQDIEESMAGVYNAIYTPNVHSNESIAATLMSDMMLGGGGPDDKSAKYVDNFEDPAEDTYRDMWTQCYSGIARANAIIEKTDDKKYILHRGRMYLALQNYELAKKDFDVYIKRDSSNAKVYINRAATRFPYGLKGIIYDCNKAIAIDSTDKNAYFLRGLANYGLDEKQKGCDDFQKSIDLGFEILKEAEYNKCSDFW